MISDITLGQFFPGNSIIHRLDPRTKIILTVLFIVAVFMASNPTAFLILFLIKYSFCVFFGFLVLHNRLQHLSLFEKRRRKKNFHQLQLNLLSLSYQFKNQSILFLVILIQSVRLMNDDLRLMLQQFHTLCKELSNYLYADK